MGEIIASLITLALIVWVALKAKKDMQDSATDTSEK